jgi:hypothetical protein
VPEVNIRIPAVEQRIAVNPTEDVDGNGKLITAATES